MDKQTAIRQLGGTRTEAARRLGVTYQAINQWPDELPQRIVDRVHAALYREANGLPHPLHEAKKGTESAAS